MQLSSRNLEFEDFYVEQAGRLKRLALWLTASPAEADDLAQEALLRAYHSWELIRGEDPGPYVRRTLVNLYRSALRRKVVERKNPSVAQARLSPNHDHGVEQAVRVAAALRCLSPIRRATVVLRFYEDLPQAEIARILERPLGTVKSDLHRALRHLRPLLDESPPPRRGPQAGSRSAKG